MASQHFHDVLSAFLCREKEASALHTLSVLSDQVPSRHTEKGMPKPTFLWAAALKAGPIVPGVVLEPLCSLGLPLSLGWVLHSSPGSPAHLIGDGLVVDEVSKGHSGCPRIVLVVDAGAGGLLLLPPGDSQLVPGDKKREGSSPTGQGRAKSTPESLQSPEECFPMPPIKGHPAMQG